MYYDVLQTLLVELRTPHKLEWKEGRKMPFGISGSIQVVMVGDNVYVGGGLNPLESQGTTVMVHSLCTGLWSTLPHYEMYQFFGMAATNNQLVLVGTLTDKEANELGVLVWDEGSHKWTHPFPNTPVTQYSLSVASYQNWILVAGGRDRSGSLSKKVKLLDTLSGQWYEGSPLPDAYSSMSSAISGNMWYLSRGSSSKGANRHVFSVCLEELISQAVSDTTSSSPSTPSPWQTLTDLPVICSTILVVNRALLTVGGQFSSAIHLYQPSSRSWIKIGDLPVERWECACVVLPSGEIFVAGGISTYNLIADRVDIASIMNYVSNQISDTT